MPSLVPNRFLVRMLHPCPHVKALPLNDDADEQLVVLPDSARLKNHADLDSRVNFAEVRIGWNDFGIGLTVEVPGKVQPPVCDEDKPRTSDGLHFWLDVRDARESHRATRFCRQFYFLPSGGGPDKTEPCCGQLKINRAGQDAELCKPEEIAFKHSTSGKKQGYRLEAFLPASVIAGFDPEQFPRLGMYYHVKDGELGDQYLAVSTDFPFSDDPSLWEILELKPAR